MCWPPSAVTPLPGKLIDQDGNVVTGNTAAVATWTAPNTEVDTEKYRKSRYNSDVEVTNTFDDADVNYWANDDEKITYLSRQRVGYDLPHHAGDPDGQR